MEHVDALEAVRRLTLERDALAEQVKRLEEQAAIRIKERDDAVQRANHAENEAARLREENAPQAPVRRERPETGTEPTEGANGAPRGCMVPSCLKCLRLWEECDRLSRSIGWGTIAQK